MAELHKRGSPLDNNGQLTQSAKKPREQAMVPSCVVKQEPEEPEEGEVSPVRRTGAVAAAAAAAAAEAMVDEPQIKLLFGLSLFHCRACLRPLRPPTIKCEAGHVVCGACRGIHAQACAAAAAGFAACPDVDVYLRGGKLACPNKEYGCEARSAYYQAGDHERACPWAPCRCPGPGCDASDSPARLAAHLAASHAWPVTDVTYARAHRIPLPPRPGGLHVLVCREDDERVFLVSASALASAGAAAAAVAASLVCVRANGAAAAGAPQFRCTLWVEDARGGVNVARVTFAVASSDLSRGFAAAEHGMFLAVPPDLLRDVPGEGPDLMVRIDKAAPAAAANPAAPPARRPASALVAARDA